MIARNAASLTQNFSSMYETTSSHSSSALATRMSRLLVTTQELCRQSLYTHWQATDPDFSGLHSLFEQQYQSLRKATDVIAARIQALGYELPMQYSGSSWGSKDSDALPPLEMVNSLIRKHQVSALEAKQAFDIADLMGDDVTVNLMSQRIIAHERASWHLLAIVENAKTQQAVSKK